MAQSDDVNAEVGKQVVTAFDEIQRGVEHLQKCLNEVIDGLPELNASLKELDKAVRILAGERGP